MLKIVKYVNIMNIRLNFIELFFISVIMVYKCIVFKKSMFLKWIFDYVLLWRYLNVMLWRLNKKKFIVNGLIEFGGNWSVKLMVYFDSLVN